MSPDAVETSEDAPEIRRLTFDLDVDICVIGGGLAGLLTAIEAAQLGASVALIEARRIAWGATGRHLGTVLPGFDVDPRIIVARIGRRAASELWRMSQTGAEIARAHAASMDGVLQGDGALRVAADGAGQRLLDEELSLGTDFGIDAEAWERDRLRDAIGSKRYGGGLHLRRAFQLDPQAYAEGLVAAARRAGVRIFEATPAVALEVSGTRKRITTPSAMLRASHVVLAGNTHLGSALPRLAKTLLPVWRFGAVTAPLGAQLEQLPFEGSVVDTDAIDHFRLSGDRLIWSSPQTTWDASPQRFAGAIRRRIRTVFPALDVKIADTFGAPVGCTVHGMPQIGQIRPGLWVASGFGRQGLNTTAMAGRIIARGILHGDDRWRLFGPFDLIWAGGRAGQVAGFAIEWAARRRAAVAGAWARRSEKVAEQANLRQARLATATRGSSDTPPTEVAGAVEVEPDADQAPVLAAESAQEDLAFVPLLRASLPPSPFLDVAASDITSQESEHHNPSAA